MNFEVNLVQTAKTDLLNIGRYIAQDNLDMALEWMDLLEKRANSLADMPMRGRAYKKRYRILTVENGYQIFYRLEQAQQKIIILHFYSPYQNWEEEA